MQLLGRIRGVAKISKLFLKQILICEQCYLVSLGFGRLYIASNYLSEGVRKNVKKKSKKKAEK